MVSTVILMIKAHKAQINLFIILNLQLVWLASQIMYVRKILLFSLAFLNKALQSYHTHDTYQVMHFNKITMCNIILLCSNHYFNVLKASLTSIRVMSD